MRLKLFFTSFSEKCTEFCCPLPFPSIKSPLLARKSKSDVYFLQHKNLLCKMVVKRETDHHNLEHNIVARQVARKMFPVYDIMQCENTGFLFSISFQKKENPYTHHCCLALRPNPYQMQSKSSKLRLVTSTVIANVTALAMNCIGIANFTEVVRKKRPLAPSWLGISKV